MARPKGMKEKNPRKRMIARGSSDGSGYLLPDSGCAEATRFLGTPSICLKCPFPECKLERNVNVIIR